MRTLALVLFIVSGCTPATSAPPVSAPAPLPTRDALVSGMLPPGPATELARAKCAMCHSEDYLVQQRLTPEQWKKTLAKMQKFGAPVTDDEAATLTTWLAALYTPDLPDR